MILWFLVTSGAPAGLKYREVRDVLLAVKGVTAVHNLHIWSLTMNQAVLTAHVAIGETELGNMVLNPGGWFKVGFRSGLGLGG